MREFEDIIFASPSALIAGAAFVVCFFFQLCFFFKTGRARKRIGNFFAREKDYSVTLNEENQSVYPQIDSVSKVGSDLYILTEEINTYLFKTKGTSDYEFIRNKVERHLKTRLDQASVYLSFPTYIGLMGTFSGVFIGILMFLGAFNDDGITDASIRNLLNGVLVSMSTSLFGLFLSTVNNAKLGKARKKVDENKNLFYDFLQTEVIKTANASLIAAVSELHRTVDDFQPAFNEIIKGFKEAFKECTKAFGEDFQKNVSTVSSAVSVMGENMDKINQNIDLQNRLIDTLKSKELVRGMEKYVEAARHFDGMIRSLDKFEQARCMMLEATQETISLQNQYSESLKIPREVAVRVNQILDRIKDFEDNVNMVGQAMTRREVLGNDVVNRIQEQINAISKRSEIADRFVELSDEKLEALYKDQIKAIECLNEAYRRSIEGHMGGFERMIGNLTDNLNKRYEIFIEEMEKKLSIESIRTEFTNLRKLVAIDEKLAIFSDTANKRLSEISERTVTSGVIHEEIDRVVGMDKESPAHLRKLEEISGNIIQKTDIHEEVSRMVDMEKSCIQAHMDIIDLIDKKLRNVSVKKSAWMFGKKNDN